MTEGNYYRQRANEAVKASKLPWELIHVQPHKGPAMN